MERVFSSRGGLQVFHAALGKSFLDDRHAVIALMTLLVMMPLSMLKVLCCMPLAAALIRALPGRRGRATLPLAHGAASVRHPCGMTQQLASLAAWSALALVGTVVLIFTVVIEGKSVHSLTARGHQRVGTSLPFPRWWVMDFPGPQGTSCRRRKGAAT